MVQNGDRKMLKNKVKNMQIDVRIDGNIDGTEGLRAHVQAIVENALSRFSERVTVVEVRLSDVNGKKGGPNDKHCMMEVRLDGCQPIGVTDQASTFEQAVKGSARKLKRSVESKLGRASTLDKLRDHR